MLMLRKWISEAREGNALPFDVDVVDDTDITVDTFNITDATNDGDVVQKEKENIDEVATASLMESEEVHGGNEATKDIEGSPNAANDGENENEGAEEGDLSAPSDDSDSDDSDEDFDSDDSDEDDSDSDDSDSDEDSDFDEDNYDEDSDSDDDYCDADSDSDAHDSHRAFDLQAAARKRLATAFATVVSKVAEDLANEIVEGDDEWDVEALMMRRFTRRSIYTCRQSRTKEHVLLVLDTSGSCYDQASFYSEIAEIAAKRGDVVIYEAPNGETTAVCEQGSWRMAEEQWWQVKNRTILFFGDFDAGWYVIEASIKNKVYWFSNEDRYSDTSEHDWCGGRSLSEFRGKYFKCFSDSDFFNSIKKIR